MVIYLFHDTFVLPVPLNIVGLLTQTDSLALSGVLAFNDSLHNVGLLHQGGTFDRSDLSMFLLVHYHRFIFFEPVFIYFQMFSMNL